MPSATAIRLDGDLNEEVWQQLPPVTGFVQRDPDDGKPATHDTEVRVAYDATSLYVAVRALDPESAKIVGILTRRDTWSPSDWVRVMVDSYHDKRTAYEFAVNAAGVKQDKYWFNDGSEDSSWDAVWDVEVKRSDRGWQAEFRIPFSQLRFNQKNKEAFGFAVARHIGRLNEVSSWPHLPKGASGYVSQFGELRGLTIGASSKRLELVPYAVGQVATEPDARSNALLNSVDPDGSFGLDLKYNLTPGLTLTGSVNPDFGQVEADPAVVNLSAFETFFSERRPFFVEGSGNFRFDISCNDGECTGLFYSRRIGRTPQGSADVPDGGSAAAPAQTTILGAAKLTGRVGAFSVGALTAVTSDEKATIALSASRYRQVIEPATSYTVVRAKREFTNQSSLGFMATSTNRRLTDTVRFLPGQAVTGGVDWDARMAGMYSLTGYLAGSTVRGTDAAISRLQRDSRHTYQRPDADHVDYDPARTALNGHAGQIAFSKIAGDRVRFNTNVGYKTPGFDINDLGFFRRADELFMGNWLQVRFDKPSKYLRSFRFNLNQWAGWNFDGDQTFGGGNVNAHWVFANQWSTGVGVNVNPGAFDDRLTRGGPGGFRNDSWNIWNYLNTDSRKAVSFGSFQSYWADGQGSRSFNYGPSVTYRATSALSLSGGLNVGKNADDAQWVTRVTTDRDHYVFGRLGQTTVSMTTRVNYTVTPTLSIQIYAEPFVSAGDYSGFKELVNGRAAAYRDRFAPFAYQANPDFNYRSFRTTNVLRWEYKPGSSLFVVWQQGREDTAVAGDFRFHRDFGGVFGAPARNVFLVKLAYWLNY